MLRDPSFHNAWEFWWVFKMYLSGYLLYMTIRAYSVVTGIFQAPYYAFSQTMMAELSPPGFDNMVSPPISLDLVPLEHFHLPSSSDFSASRIVYHP